MLCVDLHHFFHSKFAFSFVSISLFLFNCTIIPFTWIRRFYWILCFTAQFCLSAHQPQLWVSIVKFNFFVAHQFRNNCTNKINFFFRISFQLITKIKIVIRGFPIAQQLSNLSHCFRVYFDPSLVFGSISIHCFFLGWISQCSKLTHELRLEN